MNKFVKLYLILIVIIAFAVGILGITMACLLQAPIKDSCIATLGFFIAWAINNDLLENEPQREEEYEL
jgi:ABC-type sugar transport system permease subunit